MSIDPPRRTPRLAVQHRKTFGVSRRTDDPAGRQVALDELEGEHSEELWAEVRQSGSGIAD
jgi:hypothetical protein